jgi:D-glycero-alpha-D-manno-heptose-7-phosphate kinase
VIITRTPFRMSFFGGGSDLAAFYEEQGGAVLSTTIDKYMYIILKPRYDDLIVLNYSEKEIVDSVDAIRHNIYREALRFTGVTKGVEITSIADIPSKGSGLGSSSAFTVGLLNALYAYKGEVRGPAALAEDACRIEIGILGEPIGKQDQYAAAFGGLKRYVFRRDGGVDIEGVAVPQAALLALQSSCLLFFTGITRKASDVLCDQNDRIKDTTSSLRTLRDLALTMGDYFIAGDCRSIGEKLDENWKEKRKLSSKVSTPLIDSLYETGVKAGAFGGKLLGAGGGGFLLFVCPPERREAVRAALSGLRELPLAFTRYGSQVIFSFEEGVYPLQ